jgi:octaheme c-type cytochrome (tetrathionate reductase family)
MSTRLPVLLAAWAGALALATALTADPAAAADPAKPAPLSPSPPSKSTADHKKFKELDKDFASGPEVTKACLACHTEAAKQIHKTRHWTWEGTVPATGQKLGKKNVINNFCGSLSSNEPRCTSCHIGYGWKDASFDFTKEEAVDCLACHDGTGTYKKFPTGAGHPNYQEAQFPPGKVWPVPDLKKIAQGVGPTSRSTCGACHFYGGGGNAVKHGDIDDSLAMPGKALDVHMDAKGLNFSCATCHKGDSHAIRGSRFATVAFDKKGIDVPGKDDGSRATCESCHGLVPHKDAKVNDHTDRLACPTCHVPRFARGGLATKTWWDWSKAGERAGGKPVVRKDAEGNVVYDGLKGEFRWAKDVVPDYVWFNGTIRYSLIDDVIDDSGKPVVINRFEGSAADRDARIWPVKRFEGIQPYDKGRKTLAVTHTFGKDPNAYWGNFDWPKALEAGMKSVGREFSGQVGFVRTEMLWPITHMVAPKQDAVACAECHAREGRLKAVAGIYIPGRDRFAWLDLIGFGLAGLTLLGVVGHGLLRIATHRKKG